MIRRTDIPKNLASRIRTAVNRVDEARKSLIHYRHKLVQERARVAEFESNPTAFAHKYYHGLSVESYPVQTTIQRSRENIARCIENIGECAQLIEDVEANLMRTEDEVCTLVSEMRPTVGRVPWPAPPSTIDELAASYQRDWELAGIESAERHRLSLLEMERDEAEVAKKHEELEQIFIAETRAYRASLTDDEILEHDRRLRAFRAALNTGDITVVDVIDYFRQRKATKLGS